jgi:hypothetical protein
MPHQPTGLKTSTMIAVERSDFDFAFLILDFPGASLLSICDLSRSISLWGQRLGFHFSSGSSVYLY